MPDSLNNASASSQSRPWMAILMGGTIVGVLDIVYAILVYNPRNPMRILQGVASGILGRESFNGGMGAAALGLFCHFLIAFGAAVVYVLASRKLTILVRKAIVCGMIYGALVYLFMHFVVIPLSAIGPGHWSLTMLQVFEFIEHWFFVGLPIALINCKYAG